MIDPDDNDFYEDDDGPDGVGCVSCDRGWVHACCDDLCRNGSDASECADAIPCRACNPEGDYA